MKHFLPLLLFFTLFYLPLTLAQELNWAKKLGGSQADQVTGLATDGQQNAYFCGHFSGTVDMDPGTGIANRTSAGAEDIWIGKMTAAGEFVWGVSIGGTSSEKAASIVTDAAGNNWITGYFSGTVDFNPGAGLEEKSATGTGPDIFLLKLNSNGDFQWVKTFDNGSAETYTTLRVDQSGNTTLSFVYTGTVDLNPDPGSSPATSLGNSQGTAFVRLNSSGVFQWGRSLPSGRMFASTSDGAGNLYYAGQTLAGSDVDPGPGTNALPNSWQGDVAVVLKLTASGSFAFAKGIGTTGFPNGAVFNDVKLDGSGNILLCGFFKGRVDLNPGTAASDTSFAQSKNPGMGLSDAMVLKLNAAGNFQWGFGLGSDGSDFGTSIAADASGNVWLTAFSSDQMDADPSRFFSYNMNATNKTVLMKYSSAGAFLTGDILGSPSSPISVGMPASPVFHLDATGKIWLAGDFSGIMDASPGPPVTNLSATGSLDGFIFRLNPCAAAALQSQPASQSVCPGGSVQLTVTPSGTGPFVYQWRKGNTVVGTSSPTLSLTNANQNTTGQYQVAVYSLCGMVVSNPATITLRTATSLSTSPTAQSACAGSNATFSCTAAGTGPFTYVWRRGLTVVGGNNPTLNLTNLSNTDAGNYTVAVTGACNTVTSSPVALSVQTLNPTVITTGNTLSSSIQGASYQWINCNGNTPIPGQTSATFLPGASGLYAVRVTSQQGCVDDSPCVNFIFTDLEKALSESGIQVRPNPFSNEIEIQSSGSPMYQLFDVQGRLKAQGRISGPERINTRDLPEGLYFLRVGLQQFRLVK